MTDENVPAPPAPAPAVQAEEVKLPVGPLAKRAGQFALIGVLINIVSNGLGRIIDGVFLDADPRTQGILSLVAVSLLVVSRIGIIVVIIFGLIFAVRALPETAAGSGFSGRGRVIATFVLSGIFILGLIYTVVSLFMVL